MIWQNGWNPWFDLFSEVNFVPNVTFYFSFKIHIAYKLYIYKYIAPSFFDFYFNVFNTLGTSIISPLNLKFEVSGNEYEFRLNILKILSGPIWHLLVVAVFVDIYKEMIVLA